jgi:Relaxase/Mobilisation nuclease domain
VIAKGKIRGASAQLARYLMTGEKDEVAQLAMTRGLDEYGDPVLAFDAFEQIAEAHTRSTKPFFHGHIRLAPGEQLADGQWMEAFERMEQRLGFSGQPCIVSFHTDLETGEKHLHAAWFRVDFETMQAIDPGLYKNHLTQLSRTLEREFELHAPQTGAGHLGGAVRDLYRMALTLSQCRFAGARLEAILFLHKPVLPVSEERRSRSNRPT